MYWTPMKNSLWLNRAIQPWVVNKLINNKINHFIVVLVQIQIKKLRCERLKMLCKVRHLLRPMHVVPECIDYSSYFFFSKPQNEVVSFCKRRDILARFHEIVTFLSRKLEIHFQFHSNCVITASHCWFIIQNSSFALYFQTFKNKKYIYFWISAHNLYSFSPYYIVFCLVTSTCLTLQVTPQKKFGNSGLIDHISLIITFSLL